MYFVLAAELRGDDAGVEFAEDGESGQVAGEIVVRNLDRAPEFGVAQQKRFGRELEMEIARQDADDGDVLLVVAQELADDVDVAAETALPEAVAQDYYVRAVE